MSSWKTVDRNRCSISLGSSFIESTMESEDVDSLRKFNSSLIMEENVSRITPTDVDNLNVNCNENMDVWEVECTQTTIESDHNIPLMVLEVGWDCSPHSATKLLARHKKW